jgi:hypothetical protein
MANHVPVAAKALLLRGADLNCRRREAKFLRDMGQAALGKVPKTKNCLLALKYPRHTRRQTWLVSVHKLAAIWRGSPGTRGAVAAAHP